MKRDQSLVQERRQDRIERLHRPDAVAVSPSLADTNTNIGGRKEKGIFTSLKSQPFSLLFVPPNLRHICIDTNRRSILSEL